MKAKAPIQLWDAPRVLLPQSKDGVLWRKRLLFGADTSSLDQNEYKLLVGLLMARAGHHNEVAVAGYTEGDDGLTILMTREMWDSCLPSAFGLDYKGIVELWARPTSRERYITTPIDNSRIVRIDMIFLKNWWAPNGKWLDPMQQADRYNTWISTREEMLTVEEE